MGSTLLRSPGGSRPSVWSFQRFMTAGMPANERPGLPISRQAHLAGLAGSGRIAVNKNGMERLCFWPGSTPRATAAVFSALKVENSPP